MPALVWPRRCAGDLRQASERKLQNGLSSAFQAGGTEKPRASEWASGPVGRRKGLLWAAMD